MLRPDPSEAICTLFGKHVRPGMTGAAMKDVLAGAVWLNDSTVVRLAKIIGWQGNEKIGNRIP